MNNLEYIRCCRKEACHTDRCILPVVWYSSLYKLSCMGFFCVDMQFFYLLYVLSLCSKSWLEPYNSSLILMGHIPLPNLIMLTIQAFIVVSDEDCTKTFIPYKPKNTQISYFSAFVKSLWNIYWDWFELEMIAYI